MTFIFAPEPHILHKQIVFHQVVLMAWAPSSYLGQWLQGLLHIFHPSILQHQDNSLRYYWSQDYKKQHFYFSSHLQFACFQPTSGPLRYHHQSKYFLNDNDFWIIENPYQYIIVSTSLNGVCSKICILTLRLSSCQEPIWALTILKNIKTLTIMNWFWIVSTIIAIKLLVSSWAIPRASIQ